MLKAKQICDQNTQFNNKVIKRFLSFAKLVKISRNPLLKNKASVYIFVIALEFKIVLRRMYKYFNYPCWCASRN